MSTPMHYDVTAHPQLSDDARALFTRDALRFADENILAEQTLGLDVDPDYSTDAALLDKVRRAVALQLNYQLATGVVARAQTSDTTGPLSAAYRSAAGGVAHIVDPLALALVTQVRTAWAVAQTPNGDMSTAGAYVIARSARGTGSRSPASEAEWRDEFFGRRTY